MNCILSLTSGTVERNKFLQTEKNIQVILYTLKVYCPARWIRPNSGSFEIVIKETGAEVFGKMQIQRRSQSGVRLTAHLAIECLIANYCMRWRGIFKGLSRDAGREDFSL